MLHTTTDGKNTSDSGTLPSSVVWTVELMNSLVLSWRKKAPAITEAMTIRDQKADRKVLMQRPPRDSFFFFLAPGFRVASGG